MLKTIFAAISELAGGVEPDEPALVRIALLLGDHLAAGEDVLAVTGVEDIEESKHVDAAAARREVREGDVEIALCHNPAGAPLLARPGCAAVLSGHTHGNQIDLPGFDRVGPPHPGDRRDVSHGPGPRGEPRGATALITSLGLGVVGAPLRVRAPAEVVFVELTGEGGGAR